jgi:hypothetical protein
MYMHSSICLPFTVSLQAEGVVSGSELSRWRSSWGEAAEAQWVAAGQGRYKESAAQFLVSTWQGDALMVRRLALQCNGGMQPDLCDCVVGVCCMQSVIPRWRLL